VGKYEYYCNDESGVDHERRTVEIFSFKTVKAPWSLPACSLVIHLPLLVCSLAWFKPNRTLSSTWLL
jgi:hypothetical protein